MGRHNDALADSRMHAYLRAGLLVFARQVIEASRGGVDLGLQGEPQGLVILLGDQTFLRSLLGLQLPQLRLLLAQGLVSCSCTVRTGLQRALQLCLRVTKKIQLSESCNLRNFCNRSYGKVKLFQAEFWQKMRLNILVNPITTSCLHTLMFSCSSLGMLSCMACSLVSSPAARSSA